MSSSIVKPFELRNVEVRIGCLGNFIAYHVYIKRPS
jgi:hypothetical protein